MKPRDMKLQVLVALAMTVADSLADVGPSGIEDGLSRSPGHYIAAHTERVEFAGCRTTTDGELCAVRVRLLDVYAFKSPESDKPPTSILVLASRELGDQPVKPIRCLIFAVPIGSSGVYGSTFQLCSPAESALESFRATVLARTSATGACP